MHLLCDNSILESMTDMCFSPWLSSKMVRQLLGKDERYASAKSEIRQFIRKVLILYEI